MDEVVQEPNEPPAIELRNVSVQFDDTLALDDVSLRLPRGQMIAITGASGSGKSVLLRVAIGLDQPDSGQVFVEGREIEGLSEQELLDLRSRSMGMVFQEQSLFTGMSVYDNTAYRLEELGWPEAKVEDAVLEILDFVGLKDDVDKLPEELSIGMGRRLEFARALVGWPKVMLFDEATAGLDPINARNMIDLVIRARDLQNVSSLYVTKELHELNYLAKHRAILGHDGEVEIIDDNTPIEVMVLERGRIAFQGSPQELEASDLAAVTYLTHPDFSEPLTDRPIKDPWARSRHPKG
jgi:phospholipid/cholesterol/gamma-HCH transport system ATP-binding protein